MNWKEKISSRKLWAAVAGFITPLLLAFGVSSETVMHVTAVIMAGGTLITYILVQGNIDANKEED